MLVVFLGIISLIKKCSKVSNIRGRNALMAEILAETKFGWNKTRILRNCNLNSKQLKLYTEMLLEKKFLSKKIYYNGQEKLITTEKGNEFVKNFQDLQNDSKRFSAIVHHGVIYTLD